MKISNAWLRSFISTDIDNTQLSECLTDIGLEVEGIEKFENIKGSLEGIIVGKVISCQKHPNADKLKCTTVDIGSEVLSIVCGAPNVAEGQTVAVATIGTTLYTKDGNSFQIKEAKLRGEKSQGMICAEDEIGLGNSHDGIMILNESIYKIGTPLADYYTITKDEVYEIGLTPNRTDAMSHYGVARDLHAYLTANDKPSELKKPQTQKINAEGNAPISIQIENQEQTPRYLGAYLENITVKESPDWLKNYLQAIGVQSINNVVDITNYILHGIGQPMHAFDAQKVQGDKIIVGNLPENTEITTLDGVVRKSKGNEIFILDGNRNFLAMAGVIGGKSSGVSEETTSIFLESAYFDAITVRKAAKTHTLNTDASFRYERGIDPNNCKTAITLAIQLLQDLAGATLKGEIQEFYPNKIEGNTIILRYSMLDQILGTIIHREKVKEILRLLEIEILNEIPNGLEIKAPTYRVDVTREIDVIEEILRIYGYNKIEAPKKIAFTPVKLNTNDKDALENKWANILVGKGFSEVMNNSLTTLKKEENVVKLLNPLSNDLAYMRQSLLEGLLENAAYNINRKNSDIKFFELGKIYFKKEKYEERKQLAILSTGREFEENWLVPQSKTDFYYLKGVISNLLQAVGIIWEERPVKDERFSELLEFVVKGKTIVRIGKVNPKYAKEYDVEQETFFAEIELDEVEMMRNKENFKFQDIPKFNSIRRDLALLIDKKISYSELYKEAKNYPSPYLQKINLFDVYEGKNLPEGKKSYALSFELLNIEKTMEEKEISSIMNGLIKLFTEKFGAELRG